MNRISSILLLFFLILVSRSVTAEDIGSFGFNPQGFANPRGGRGGPVIRVTTLDSAGPGSLRAALETKGARIVVFEVGGVIDLNKQALQITEPFLTIAGQTAPSPGITIIRGGISVRTHDVLIQHLRVRPGDVGEPKRSGWATDGISTSGGNAHDVTIDHCSISWATDENLSASGPRTEGPEATSHRITFSNCIIAEGLSNSTHPKGPHSKGSLIHDFCRDIAVIGNFYAHNVHRNPYFKSHTTGVIVNNLIYNPGKTAIQLNYPDSEWQDARFKPKNCRVSVVGNVLIYGVDTRDSLALVSRRGDAYLADNLAFDREGKPVALVAGNINELEAKPVWPEGLNPLAAKEVVDFILKYAGARPWDRDETDQRLIREFLERKGRIIDSQDDVGGYPKPEKTTRRLDVPAEGIEAWLDGFAREKSDTIPQKRK